MIEREYKVACGHVYLREGFPFYSVYEDSDKVGKVTITHAMVFFSTACRKVDRSPKNRKPINATILKSGADKMTLTIEGGLMLLINFAALTGNLLMCFVFYKKPRFHTTANTIILSLTIFHVFTFCLVMPFIAGSLVAVEWTFGQTFRDIHGLLFLAFIIAVADNHGDASIFKRHSMDIPQ